MRGVEDRPPGPEWDGHLLSVHDPESAGLTDLAAWVCRGLERGSKIVFSEGSDGHDTSVIQLLGPYLSDPWGVTVDAAVAAGRLVTLPIEQLYPLGGPDAVCDRALAEGFASVRLTGEVATARTALPRSGHLALERRLNRLCRTRSVSVLCRLARSVGWPLVAELIPVHRGGLRAGALDLRAIADGLVVRGEVDRADADVFAAAVAAACTGARRPVCLDLVAVEFLDVAACRQLLAASAPFRRAGGHLILAAARPEATATLRLLGVDEFTGVVVEENVP